MGNVYFLPHVAEDNLWVKNDKTADLDTISIQFFYIYMYYAYGGGYSQGGGGWGSKCSPHPPKWDPDYYHSGNFVNIWIQI